MAVPRAIAGSAKGVILDTTRKRTIRRLKPTNIVVFTSVLNARFVSHFQHRVMCSSSEGSTKEIAKLITKTIVKTDDWKDIRNTLEEYEASVNIRHLTTALYFLTKKNVRVLSFSRYPILYMLSYQEC